MRKPILCLDFDGVIHSYSSGWKGAAVIPDPPVDGAIEFLKEAVKHFDVQIFSSRSHQVGGINAMRIWLMDWARKTKRHGDSLDWLRGIKWPAAKPPAKVSIDDRALTFRGSWPSMESLSNFEPWNKT